jgi:hypothetical protein
MNLKPKTWIATGVIAASVTAGAVGGALLFTPSLSGAEEDGTATIAAEDPRPDGPGHGRHFLGGSLEAAAEALGLDVADLRTELRDGKTIADVAKEKNVDIQTVIDALVADAKEKLQELEANLPQQMADLVNGKLAPPHDGMRRGRPGHFAGAGLEVAAGALGIEESALRDELHEGKTIADVAKEKNVDIQTVIDALVADATEKIDEAVAAGRLPQDRADEMKAHLEERVTAMVNGEHHRGPGGGFGDHPAPPPAEADA